MVIIVFKYSINCNLYRNRQHNMCIWTHFIPLLPTTFQRGSKVGHFLSPPVMCYKIASKSFNGLWLFDVLCNSNLSTCHFFRKAFYVKHKLSFWNIICWTTLKKENIVFPFRITHYTINPIYNLHGKNGVYSLLVPPICTTTLVFS